MEFQNLVCANCGGTDFKKLSDREYRCTHCQGLLISTANPQPVPYYRPDPEPVVPQVDPVPVFAKVIGITMVILIAFIFLAFFAQKKSPSYKLSPGSGYQPINIAVSPTPVGPKLEINVAGKVKGSFGSIYLKCLVTNITGRVLRDPMITVTLYKNDVKLGTAMGIAELKFLKPRETTPIWVDLGDYANYTRAEAHESMMLSPLPVGNATLFPDLKFIDAKMTTDFGNSSYNGRIYREKFYTVTGTVQNELYEKVSPQLYVIFYDSKSEVVGVESGSSPELNKGEKGNFEVSAGETQLFGVPARYEIVAVDPNGR